MANMVIRNFAVLLALPVLLLAWSPRKCPSTCSCVSDQWGRRAVRCLQGRYIGVLPLPNTSTRVEVIEILAPKFMPNSYKLGPSWSSFYVLEELHVVSSQVPAIGLNTFNGLHHLLVLNLSHNRITALFYSNFDNLDALKQLDLSYNLIERVPSDTFRYLPNLQNLNLAWNRLTNLASRAFNGPNSLRRLDVSFNPVKVIDVAVLEHLKTLQKIAIRGCSIDSIHNLPFDGLASIEVVDLGENRIQRITKDHFNRLRFLRRLNLDRNLIAEVQGSSFKGNTNLRFLNLSMNRITQMEDDLFQENRLTTLDLSYNNLSEFRSRLLLPLSYTLTELHVSGNLVSTGDVANILSVTPFIKRIGLAEMRLRYLPSEIQSLRSLEALNVSGNFLEEFDMSSIGFEGHIKVLDLRRNRIRFITGYESLSHVKEVLLEDNKWVCERCHLPVLMRPRLDQMDNMSGVTVRENLPVDLLNHCQKTKYQTAGY